jgi:hypothetical protein
MTLSIVPWAWHAGVGSTASPARFPVVLVSFRSVVSRVESKLVGERAELARLLTECER